MLSEIFLNYFESVYENYYFSKNEKENLSNEEKVKILKENNFQIGLNAYDYLTKNYNSNNNLILLKRIAFLKQYFNHYTNNVSDLGESCGNTKLNVNEFSN